MAYLTHEAIKDAIRAGDVVIRPAVLSEHIGPNSIDMHLHRSLLVYKDNELDLLKDNPTEALVIPPEGLVLYPGQLYLGRTIEHTTTVCHVPCVEGRSSIGRLGMGVHVTAGFGDVGFSGTWTLEITVVKPLRIYAGARICQLTLQTVEGATTLYDGRYQDQEAPTASRYTHRMDISNV